MLSSPRTQNSTPLSNAQPHATGVTAVMGSSGNNRATTSLSNGVAAVFKGVNFADYFCTYAFLYHQKKNTVRPCSHGRYFNAIFENKHHFQGKTVLDIGTGSGILAIWSAQSGARKVYAVEATKMAEYAGELVKANKLQNVVEVIEGSMEDVTLPEKVICACERWLKPDGIMYPSHAHMWVAPIRTISVDQKMSDYEGVMDDWYNFVDESKAYYGVDMTVLKKPFSDEQRKSYLQTSLWNNLHPNQVIGTAAVIKEIDCLTATVWDILNVRAAVSSSVTTESTRLCGYAGWFDVHFRNPAQKEIELRTAPSEEFGTR